MEKTDSVCRYTYLNQLIYISVANLQQLRLNEWTVFAPDVLDEVVPTILNRKVS